MKIGSEIENGFSFADYCVFVAMLAVSTAIGIYYAFKVCLQTLHCHYIRCLCRPYN